MRRRIIVIIIAVLILVIPAVIALIIVKRSPKLQNVVLKVANVNTVANTNSAAANVNTVKVTDPQAKDRQAITFVSRNFAEQYGSGSNQNNFANLIDAETFGTPNFNTSLDRSIAQQKTTLKTTPFTSTITKALSITISGLTASTATVVVTTQRQETIDRSVRTYYQDLLLQMLKVGADWKVNGAGWKTPS